VALLTGKTLRVRPLLRYRLVLCLILSVVLPIIVEVVDPKAGLIGLHLLGQELLHLLLFTDRYLESSMTPHHFLIRIMSRNRGCSRMTRIMVIILRTVFCVRLVFLACYGPLSQLGRIVGPTSLRLLIHLLLIPLVAFCSASPKLFRARWILLLLPFKLIRLLEEVIRRHGDATSGGFGTLTMQILLDLHGLISLHRVKRVRLLDAQTMRFQAVIRRVRASVEGRRGSLFLLSTAGLTHGLPWLFF